jgi:hypothetical protein
MTQRPSREHRNAMLIDRAARFQRFLDDADIAAWLTNYERTRIEEIATAAPNDDDIRRAAALRLQAMRALRAELQTVAATGGKLAEATAHNREQG